MDEEEVMKNDMEAGRKLAREMMDSMNCIINDLEKAGQIAC